MKTIHKYPIPIADRVAVQMPMDALPLTVQVQRGEPQLWALVDDALALVEVEFAWRGTGKDCTGLEANRYVGSVQLEAGALVFHLFELR